MAVFSESGIKFTSIRTRIATLIILFMVILTVALGSVSWFFSSRIVTQDSQTMIREITKAQAISLDSQLQLVERSVDALLECAEVRLTSADWLSNPSSNRVYSAYIGQLSLDLARNTQGCMSVYMRLNPAITGSGTDGFWYLRPQKDSAFEISEPTDINAYDRNDFNHVGWWYTPIEAHSSVWMPLYYNANIDRHLISYVAPIYKNKIFVGIIGMDIDFSVFLTHANQIDFYPGAYATLVDINTQEMYSWNRKLITEKISSSLNDFLLNNDNALSQPVLNHNNTDSIVSFMNLSNGMDFVLFTPEKELSKDRVQMVRLGLILALCILIISMIFILLQLKRFIQPIVDLTKVADQYAKGNWEAVPQCRSHDEVERLADSIGIMAERTRGYIQILNDKATTDAMTGVKNKAAYMEYADKAVRQIQRGIPCALIVFDVNNLKFTNDTYGHEAGDALIISASRLICNTFLYSPVFRIGGDEFATILWGRDFEHRLPLITEFEKHCNRDEFADADHPVLLSLAYGMASSEEGCSTMEEMFALADRRMYEKKTRMKSR